jgi:diaminopimelate decarboxylase
MTLSWTFLRSLEDQYGDSFYLFDPRGLERNYTDLLGAFREHYANTHIAYSYKTNYLPRICRAVDRLGGYAEVVSGMEYDLARRVGVRPDRVIFNGPYKQALDIERALRAGSIVNLDSSHELDVVEDVARRHPEQRLAIGLRCNVDLGIGGTSRFGFEIEGSELATAFARLARLDGCSVAGLHCHAMTPGQPAALYALITRRLLEVAGRHFRDQPPRFLDVGGGFSSRMAPELRAQFAHPIPTFSEYAEAIAPQVTRAYGPNGPQLVLEPGLALTADTMWFVAKVVDVKTLRFRRVALVSGSIFNIKPTRHDKSLPWSIVSPREEGGRPAARLPVDVVGYTCLEDDCLYQDFAGELAVGDYLVVGNVGAYTTVLKPPFINPCPAIVSYDSETGECELVKRRETTADLCATYTF